jgi:hypothetical protein
MIDFSKNPVFKLSRTSMDANCNADDINKILIGNENVLHIFASYRDAVVFTNKRIIAINVQGLSGKKKDFTSLPYSKIQVYSVETAGAFDRDAEMELYFSGLGKVKFEFTAGTNVGDLSRLISTFVL